MTKLLSEEERKHVESCEICKKAPKLDERCLTGQVLRVAAFVAQERARKKKKK